MKRHQLCLCSWRSARLSDEEPGAAHSLHLSHSQSISLFSRGGLWDWVGLRTGPDLLSIRKLELNFGPFALQIKDKT